MAAQSKRIRVVSENVANADTPGYKARDLSPFSAMMALKEGPQTAIGRSREMKTASVSPNGNSVALDEQMVMASESKMQHETALAIYRKSMDLLKMGLGRR